MYAVSTNQIADILHFNDSIKYLQEYISFEIRIDEKYCIFVCFYGASNQTNDEFEFFLKNLELALDKIYEENPFMISIVGDSNAKSNNWCKIDTTPHEGPMIDAVTSNYGLHQLIQEQTHIRNLPSPCIDLIFTSQPNLFMESGVHSTLHPNCHHQVVFAKLNLYILYPSPYERTELFGFMKKQMLSLSKVLLMNLIGQKPYLTLV